MLISPGIMFLMYRFIVVYIRNTLRHRTGAKRRPRQSRRPSAASGESLGHQDGAKPRNYLCNKKPRAGFRRQPDGRLVAPLFAPFQALFAFPLALGHPLLDPLLTPALSALFLGQGVQQRDPPCDPPQVFWLFDVVIRLASGTPLAVLLYGGQFRLEARVSFEQR